MLLLTKERISLWNTEIPLVHVTELLVTGVGSRLVWTSFPIVFAVGVNGMGLDVDGNRVYVSERRQAFSRIVYYDGSLNTVIDLIPPDDVIDYYDSPEDIVLDVCSR